MIFALQTSRSFNSSSTSHQPHLHNTTTMGTLSTPPASHCLTLQYDSLFGCALQGQFLGLLVSGFDTFFVFGSICLDVWSWVIGLWWGCVHQRTKINTIQEEDRNAAASVPSGQCWQQSKCHRTGGFMGPRIHWTIKQLGSIISDQAAPCYAAARAVAGNVVAMLPSSSHLGTLHWLHTTLSVRFWTIDFSWKIIENCKEAISHLRREQFISGGGGSQSPQLGNYYKQIQQEELFSISPISLSNLVSIYLKWSTDSLELFSQEVWSVS